LTGNGRAVALRVLAAVGVFWVAEFVLLVVYVLFVRAGYGSTGSASLNAAAGLIALAAAAVAAWFVTPRLRRVGVAGEAVARFAAAGPLAASLLVEVVTLFAGGALRLVVVLAGTAFGGALGALLRERGAPITGPGGSRSTGGASRPINPPRWPRPR